MTEAGWAREVHDFWFGLPPKKHWQQDDEFDAEVAERFRNLWEEQARRPVAAFLGDPQQALAAIILFDQFPRNMFRGHADSFATDHLALAISNQALDRGYDEQLSKDERAFLLMPFEHSEDREDQKRSVLLFTALGSELMLGYAKKHRDVIERFGRFPHRNALLGRKPTAEEEAAGLVTPF